MRAARGIDDHQPFIAPDAVFGMNDEIAFFKGADFAQEILATPAPGPRPTPALHLTPTQGEAVAQSHAAAAALCSGKIAQFAARAFPPAQYFGIADDDACVQLPRLAAALRIATAEAGTGALLKDLHELLLRLEERSNPATDTTHYGNSRVSATSFYQHYARHIGAAVQDAFGGEMLRVEACLGQAWLKRQRVLRDPGLIDDPRPPPKRREPSA